MNIYVKFTRTVKRHMLLSETKEIRKRHIARTMMNIILIQMILNLAI